MSRFLRYLSRAIALLILAACIGFALLGYLTLRQQRAAQAWADAQADVVPVIATNAAPAPQEPVDPDFRSIWYNQYTGWGWADPGGAFTIGVDGAMIFHHPRHHRSFAQLPIRGGPYQEEALDFAARTGDAPPREERWK